METQNTMKSQSNPEKKQRRNLRLGRIRLLVFRLYCKATVTETICYWHQKQKYRSMEQDGKSRDKPMHLRSPMTKEARIHNGEKTVSSISGAGKTGQLHHVK